MSKQATLLATALLVTACGARPVDPSSTQEAWNAKNDPLQLSGEYERTLASLPLTGALDTTPWSDTYWPSNQAGISNRWKLDDDPFAYVSPDFGTLLSMSIAERAVLSPAEKFDAFVGRYDYPLVQRERARTSPDRATWEGICHGWAPAALNFAEPKPILIEGANGVAIPFGSADVKALLSYYQGEMTRPKTKFLGSRCNFDLATNPEAALNPECRDTNAGAFHVVVANQLGILKQGFVADVTRDVQVWNQPIHGFSAQILAYQPPSAGAAVGTVQEAVVQTVMTYTIEVAPKWDALVGTPANPSLQAIYDYRVELDANGVIIGGEWLGEARPDFLWTQERPAFQGYFQMLGTLYEAALAGEPFADPTEN